MKLRESIESINIKLLNEYGMELHCGNKPRFRVVFSEDQYEKRITSYTDEGLELTIPEVRLLPKYKQYIKAKYVLERLIPVVGETDLVEKVSYEPAWVFQDKSGNYLPPFFDGCKLVIESLLNAVDRAGLFTKYKDNNISREEHLAHIEKVEAELFGNESSITDALAAKTAVTVN